MGPRSKKEYTETTHRRYKNASRAERTVILNEFCATSGYHRKYAIRLLPELRENLQSEAGKPAIFEFAI